MQLVPYRLRLNSTSHVQPAPRVDWRGGERHPDQLACDSVILGSAGALKEEPNSRGARHIRDGFYGAVTDWGLFVTCFQIRDGS